jgi:hypothetical protein
MSEPKTFLTAIVVDYMGSNFGENTPEMEAAEHKKRYEELLFPAKLDVYTPAGVGPSYLKDGTDLILYDYGGLMPGTSLMEDNSRRLVDWAENHSSCLIVVVSAFTYRNYVAYECRERGLEFIHNIVVEDYLEDPDSKPGFPIPEWFREMHKLPAVDLYEAGLAIKAGLLTIPEKQN